MANMNFESIKDGVGMSPIFYVCRDIERALGEMKNNFLSVNIITNVSRYGREMAKENTQITFVESDRVLDTWELLSHPKTKSIIKQGDRIVVFKNTAMIEKICRDNGWTLLNPSASLSSMVEEKISQVKWLGELSKYLPRHEILFCKNLQWRGKKTIAQFNRSHTGIGTILIDSEEKVKELIDLYPEREARVSEYIEGPVFTSNNVVNISVIFTGNISYQITGLAPFTSLPFATIGNDWTLPRKLLSRQQVVEYINIVKAVGEKLRKDGWRGLFGVDIIMNSVNGKIYLLEINARQPASTTYESQLQSNSEISHKENHLTVFEAHLLSLLGIDLAGYGILDNINGAQIIYRVSEKIQEFGAESIKKLHDLGLRTIQYDNTKDGADLLRVQGRNAFMENHAILNDIGLKIAKIS